MVRGVLVTAALGVSGGGLFIEVGFLGAAVGFVGVLVAIMSTGIYGVAVQHLGSIAVLGSSSVVAILALETAALFLLVSDSKTRLETGTLFIPVAVSLAVGTVVVASSHGFVAASTALVGVVGLSVYVFHRYAAARVRTVRRAEL
jgi:hypothetical protein